MKKAAKVISIITLVIFIIGMVFAIGALLFGTLMGVVADGAYDPNLTGYEALGGLFKFLGGGLMSIVGLLGGLMLAIYDVIAHIPALIAHIVWKKTENKVVYWIFVGIYAVLLIGAPYFMVQWF